MENGFLYYKNRLLVPNSDKMRLEIAESEHDSHVAGHFSQSKTNEKISRNFYWPNMEQWIDNYVSTCDGCQRHKSTRHARYGLHQPLELTQTPWESISVDFITQLPPSDDHHQIMVVVDRFTKMAHFVHLNKSATTSDVAKAFLQIWKLHGLPADIVSDRDPKFTAEFW